MIGAGAVTTGARARASLAEDTIAIDPLAPPPVLPPRTAEVSYVLASTATLPKSGVATTYAAAAGARTAGLQVIPIAHAG